MAKHAADDTTDKKKRSARGSASNAKLKREGSASTASAKPKRSFRQVATTAIIVIFAILMGISVMLPTIAQVYSSNAARRQAEEDYEAALAAQGSAEGSEAGTDYDLSTVDGVLEAYATIIKNGEDKLADDPTNLASLLNIAQVYMNCAYNAAQLASTDDEATKVVEYFQKAEEYFDQYLDIKETDAVKVDRALCELYQGNVEEAVTELRAITAASPDYAPAWMNLGMAYEVVSMNDAAIAAYGKAQETDPDNEYGARLFATNRIQQLQSDMTSQELSYETGDTTTTENNGVLNLWNDLSSGSASSQTTAGTEAEGDAADAAE